MDPLAVLANVLLTLAVVAGFAFRGRPRTRRAIFTALGLVGVVYFALAGVWLPLHRHGVDFNQYLVGAAELWAGRDPYADYATFVVTRDGPIREVLENLGLPEVPPVSYPPPFYIAVSPLLLLPPDVAFAAWTLCNVVFWLIAVFLTCRAMGLRTFVPTWSVLGLSLLSNPVVDNMYLGQANIVIALFLSAAVYALSRRRPYGAGVWTAITVVIKTFSATALVWFALRRRWRDIAIATGILTAVVVAVAVAWGPTIWYHYIKLVVFPAMTGPIMMAVNTAVATAPVRFAPPDSEAVPYLVWLGKAIAIAALGWSLWYLRRERLDPRGEFSFIIVIGLIANNWVTAPYLTAALPAFVYLGRRILAGEAGKATTIITAASFLALAWRFDYRILRTWPTTPILALKPLALLALGLAFVLLMARHPHHPRRLSERSL